MKNQPYLLFLETSNTLFHGITANQRKVLKAIFIRVSDGPCHVKDIIGIRSIASLATLHKTLNELVNDDYITLEADPSDGRAKLIVLTKKARLLIFGLNKSLIQSTNH